MWVWLNLFRTYFYTPLEYYDLVNVSQPVVASHNTTCSAVTFNIGIKQVSALQ